MQVKKTSRKNISLSEGKENVNISSEQPGHVRDLSTTNSESTSNSPMYTTIESEAENETLADISVLKMEHQSTVGTVGDDEAVMDVIEKDGETDVSEPILKYTFTTENQHTNSPKTRGNKRRFDQIENLIEHDESLSRSNGACEEDTLALKKKCKKLVARVKELESDWMPRPDHPKVIKYLIEAADVLRTAENDIDGAKDQDMIELIKSLGFEEDEVLQCKKPTSTATARQLIKLKYPNPEPSFGLRDIDNTTINHLIRLTQCLHPSQSSKSKIRKALGNYFATIKYKRKMKSKISFHEQAGENNLIS